MTLYDKVKRNVVLVMITNKIIKLLAKKSGADLCGVASIDRFSKAPKGFHPRDIYKPTRSVIALAISVPDSALASPNPVPYTFFAAQILNEVLRTTLKLVRELDQKGIVAVPIPSEPYEYWDKDTMTGKGILSLRHIAALAGMGMITRNNLLTNSRFGNRITLGAVLTNAEIASDPIRDEPKCPSSCNVCRTICPVNAITDNGTIQKLCRSKAEFPNEKGYHLYWCRLCREKCPLSKGKKVGKVKSKK